MILQTHPGIGWSVYLCDLFYETAPEPNDPVLFYLFPGGGPLGLQDSQRPFHFPTRTLSPGHFASRVGKSQVVTARSHSDAEKQRLCAIDYDNNKKKPPATYFFYSFQFIVPKKWKRNRPVCIHLAGTGDHVSKRFVSV